MSSKKWQHTTMRCPALSCVFGPSRASTTNANADVFLSRRRVVRTARWMISGHHVFEESHEMLSFVKKPKESGKDFQGLLQAQSRNPEIRETRQSFLRGLS